MPETPVSQPLVSTATSQPFMQFEEITTNRLILRKITQKVLDYIYQHFAEQQQMEFLGINSISELEVERKKYEGGLSTHNKKFLYFQLLDLGSHAVVGWCGYHTWYTDHKRAEIGYGIFQEENKGKGFMSEAMLKIIEYGFSKMELNRIEAFISPENTASIKLVTKFQFAKEGELRQHYFHKGNMEDSAVYGLLKSDYLQNK